MTPQKVTQVTPQLKSLKSPSPPPPPPQLVNPLKVPTLKLLSNPSDNPKVKKNLGIGVLTSPLHLAPYNLSGYQVCPKASQGCAAACLHTAGNPAFMEAKNKGRIRKTKMFFEDRLNFMSTLIGDIEKLQTYATLMGYPLGIRLNATSDFPYENLKVTHKGVSYANLFEIFPSVQFYDYGAVVKRMLKPLPKNYHLTFSRKEDNHADCLKALEAGVNVAVVFRKKLPDTYLGSPVINGDLHDYRPLDGKHKRGVIVGLKAKGLGRSDTSGFVVDIV